MKIIFCIPGRNFSNNFLTSWTRLLKYCHQNNIQAELSNGYVSIVHLARYSCLMINPESTCKICLNPFSETTYDYIMWIDSDMVFNPEDFEKLLKSDKDVITGLAKVEATNQYACFKKEKNERITEEYLKDNSGIIETSFTGMSFMLIKRGVYERMPFPYFSVPGESGMLSETLSFCHNLSKANIPIYAHLDVVIGHEKPMII